MKPANKMLVIARLINEVLDGSKSATSAISEWPDIDAEGDSQIKRLWHTLYHYRDDEDIRQKEPKYDAMMRNALRKLVAQIGENAENGFNS